MSRPNGMTLSSPSARQLAQLHQWCVEWALDGALCEQAVAEDPDNAENAPPAAVPSPAEDICDLRRAPASLQSGTIALLAPCDDPANQGAAPPLYLAIVPDPADGSLLALPFSRFTVPATPTELTSGRTAAALRVVALWNARPITNNLHGWTLDPLTPSEIDLLVRAYRAVQETGQLPAEMAAAGGPPLTHPADPRRLYLREARAVMDHYMRPAPTRLFRYPLQTRPPEALPRAAEEAAEYGRDADPPPDAP